MSGINRDIIPDPRPSLVDRHLPNIPQVQRLLRREGKAHVFNDHTTLEQVTRAIITNRERTGVEDENDNYERYGLYFSEQIGYIDEERLITITQNGFWRFIPYINQPRK